MVRERQRNGMFHQKKTGSEYFHLMIMIKSISWLVTEKGTTIRIFNDNNNN